MAEVASAFVSIVPSARGFGRSLESQVGSETTTSGARVGKSFGRALFGAVAAVGAAMGVTKLLSDSIGEAREAQKVGALTTQVIKSTGGAAHVSARQVGDLATSLSNKVGVDDEAIQSGMNMLLTFKNIRNEAGRGNKIFNQAAKTTTDLAAAMAAASGGELNMRSASIQMGKALNDPVKGITALSRVGVTFTDGQKKQIKTLVESGNIMGAQKIILRELRSEFGGAAAAQATAGDKAKVAMGNLKETIGTALLPVIDKLSNTFTTKIAPALTTFVTGMQNGTGAGGRFVAVMVSVANAVKTTVGFLIQHKNVVVGLTAATVALVAITQIHGAVLAVQAAGGLVAYLRGITLVQTATKVWAAVQWALNAALTANPIGLVIAGIVALGVGLVVAYKKSATFRNIVNGAFSAVRNVVGAVVGWLGRYVPGVFAVVVGLVRGYVNVYRAVVVGAFNGVRAVVTAAVGAFRAFASAAGAAVGRVVSLVAGLPGKITAAVGNLGGLLVNAGKSIIQGLINGIGQMIKPLTDKLHAITSLIPKHKGPESKDRKLLEPAGRAIMDGLLKGLKAKEQALKDQLSAITDQIEGLKSSAADLMSGIADKFKVDVFGGNLKQLRAGLAQSTADAQAFLAALGAGIKNGLSGAFYQSLAQSGNLKLAQEIAALSPSDLAALQGQFGARNSAADLVGQKVSDDFFAKPIHDQTAVLNGIRADLQAVLKREHKIEIHDKSGNPKKTARETSRRLRWAGAR